MSKMAFRRFGLAIGFSLSLVGTAAVAAVTHTSKQVGQFLPPDGRACAFFQLQGVAEADPIRPGNNWFALPTSQNGYKEIMATLLTAKATDKTVTVRTKNQLACGNAEVQHVILD